MKLARDLPGQAIGLAIGVRLVAGPGVSDSLRMAEGDLAYECLRETSWSFVASV